MGNLALQERIVEQRDHRPPQYEILLDLSVAMIVSYQFPLAEAINAGHTLFLIKQDALPTWWQNARTILT